MSADAEQDTVLLLQLPRDVARYLERTLADVGEHLAAGAEILPGPPAMDREITALMWDLRDALGERQPYDLARPPSRKTESYVVR